MDDYENLVRIYFSTHYMKEHPDHALAISGSIPELGQWDAGSAVIAGETPHKPGEWVLRMQLKSNTQFEWKWVVICRKTLTILRWEERPNRCTQLQDKIWTCHAPWNHDANYKLMYNCPVRKMAKKDKGNTESEDIPETGDAPPGRLTALRSVVTWPFRCINRFYQSIAGLVRRDN